MHASEPLPQYNDHSDHHHKSITSMATIHWPHGLQSLWNSLKLSGKDPAEDDKSSNHQRSGRMIAVRSAVNLTSRPMKIPGNNSYHNLLEHEAYNGNGNDADDAHRHPRHHLHHHPDDTRTLHSDYSVAGDDDTDPDDKDDKDDNRGQRPMAHNTATTPRTNPGMLTSQKMSDRLRLEQAIVDLFRRYERRSAGHAHHLLEPGKLACLHQLVRNLLGSNAGLFLQDYYCTQIIPKGLQILNLYLDEQSIIEDDDDVQQWMDRLQEVWLYFYTEVLPLIDCILYRVKSKCNSSIRQVSMLAFRDDLLLKSRFEEFLRKLVREDRNVSPEIRNMLLTLNATTESYPPNKSKLKIESLASMLVTPFVSYRGIHLDRSGEPTIMSNEPAMYANRRSFDAAYRRISRPLAAQPKQMETLNELFIKVIRKQNHHY